MFIVVLMIGFLSFNKAEFSLPVMLILMLAIVGELLMHSATNILNDVYDFYKGIDSPDLATLRYNFVFDKEVGPRRAQSISLVFFLSSAALGVAVAVLGRPLAILLGLLGIFFGYFYSAPPLELKYRALGDLAVIVSMLLLTLTGYYLASGSLSLKGLAVGIPMAFIIDDVLMANNIRDLGRDSKRAKTLATVLGPELSKAIYYVFMSVAYVVQAALVVLGILPPETLLSLLSLPLLFSIARKVKSTKSWLQIDMMTANLAIVFGLFEIMGLILHMTL
ncbi:predicted 1,4-dihydroxy-2-naphthoate octaprenyltransferase [Acidilobus saccharovorans 345-15]|uniref:Predicted 1,4-dihydroxy-2-naphthoate octaprenyltransferase n=2 Tax=Acidilobus TaxID=105850 RepID=D9Q011_ACIS3|nr:predicted 1,4-dihydroxy-2-naphthoate octaprenyltransferase [Acidilobus saccharovorans 345-15]